jgi:hypothetical protein
MDAKEMHAFESAMMNDPFLADAIEGYRNSNNDVAQKHLGEIKSQIATNKQPAKVVPLSPSKTAWWKAAAIVFIIVTGAAISYMLFRSPVKNEPSSQIAQTKPEEEPVSKDSTGPVDNSIRLQKRLTKETLTSKKKGSPINQYQAEEIADAVRARQTKPDTFAIAMADKVTAGRESLVSAAPAAAQKDEAIVEARKSMAMSSGITQNEFKGRIIDTMGRPLRYASIVTINKGTTADLNGNFTLKSPDSVLRVSVSAFGFAGVQTQIKSGPVPTTIILQPGDTTLSEAVVPTKKRDVAGSLSKMRNKEQTAGSPEGGWDNFNNYVKREVESFRDNTDTIYNKIVTLEFSIDEKGNPTDIQMIRDADNNIAGEGITDKAIQILMSGPRWVRNKSQSKVKVAIEF